METQDTPPPPASLGREFAAERERQGLTRSEISQRLHLSSSQIEALEEDRFESLPRGPFLRGFVRNYSKVLGLDPEAMIARLAAAAPRDAAPRIVVPSQNIRFGEERLSNSPYVRAGAYWWLFIKPTPPAQEAVRAAPAPSGPPQQIAAAPVAPAETPPPSMPATEPVKEAPAPESAPPAAAPEPAKSAPPQPAKPAVAEAKKPAPEPAKAAAPARDAAEGARLHFRFRGDSWVEVRDAQGRVIHSRVNARGSEADVTAKPPLTVVVGNASEVSVLVNDRAFPLEPHTKVAVARFTVE